MTVCIEARRGLHHVDMMAETCHHLPICYTPAGGTPPGFRTRRGRAPNSCRAAGSGRLATCSRCRWPAAPPGGYGIAATSCCREPGSRRRRHRTRLCVGRHEGWMPCRPGLAFCSGLQPTCFGWGYSGLPPTSRNTDGYPQATHEALGVRRSAQRLPEHQPVGSTHSAIDLAPSVRVMVRPGQGRHSGSAPPGEYERKGH